MKKIWKLTLVLPILLPVLTWSFLSSTVLDLYYMRLSKIDSVQGFVENVDSSIDVEGILSYEYTFKYSVNGKQYYYSEIVSMDSLSGISIGDSTKVIYSVVNPKRSTISGFNSINNALAGLFVLLAFEAIFLFESVSFIRRYLKNRNSNLETLSTNN